MVLTLTKKKRIMQELGSSDGTIVPRDRLLQLVSRHQSTVEDVSSFLQRRGYHVQQAVKAVPSGAPVALLDPVPAEVVRSILRGDIYAVVGDYENDPDSCYVVTKLSRFRKEREAIRKLVGFRQ